MPDTDIQPIPEKETTPPAREPQTPTPAPEFSITNNPQQTTDNSQSIINNPTSIETQTPPPPAPITNNQQPATDNQTPTTQTPQPSEPTQTPQPIQAQSSQPQPPSEQTRPHPRSFLQRAREKIQFRKKAKLEKIMALAVKKRSITNDDIEKLLRVSDATATRYCAELVRQGRLKRAGSTSDIQYEPTS